MSNVKTAKSTARGQAHLGVGAVQDATGAAAEAQEPQLCLLQPRVAGDGLQHKGLHLLRIVWPLPENELQQQAVILVCLRETSAPDGQVAFLSISDLLAGGCVKPAAGSSFVCRASNTAPTARLEERDAPHPARLRAPPLAASEWTS